MFGPMVAMVPDSIEWLATLPTTGEVWGSLGKRILHNRQINIAGAWLMGRMRKAGFTAAQGMRALLAYREEVRSWGQHLPLEYR